MPTKITISSEPSEVRKFINDNFGFISEKDFDKINKYKYDITFNKNEAIIDLPFAKIYVDKRPKYCDRGRFAFYVEVKNDHRDKVTIDAGDAFPRYFFKMENAQTQC